MRLRHLQKICPGTFFVTCGAYTCDKYVRTPWLLSGDSMEPCLGCIVLASPWPYACGRLQRGDIVITRNPTCPQESVCKRIRGLPGDKIAVAGTSDSLTDREDAVPNGYVWIEGDNKSSSVDSRDYGPIPMGLLQGKVVLCVYPNWRSCQWYTQFGL